MRMAKSGRSPIHTLMGVQVLATGSAVPKTVVRNADLAAQGFDADWIVQRSGIQERRWISEGQATSDLAFEAAERCIDRAGISPADIDLILLGTITPDMGTPSTACLLQDRLGITASAVDLNAACAGFMYSMATGSQFLHSGASRMVLAIGADTLSTIINPNDKKTYPLFGDGAGAALLCPGTDEQGLLACALGSEGDTEQLLCKPAGGSRRPVTPEVFSTGEHYLHMDGRAVFKWAVRLLPEVIADVLHQANLTTTDLDLVVLHQANIRIIDAATADLGIDRDKLVVNLDRYGNTSAASIPLALDEANQQGRISRGDKVLLCGFGSGFSWGAAIVQW